MGLPNTCSLIFKLFIKILANFKEWFIVSLWTKDIKIWATSESSLSKSEPTPIKSDLFSLFANFSASLSDAVSDKVYIEAPRTLEFFIESACKDKNNLAKFIKQNIYGNKIVIGMGAGSISSWMKELPKII